MKVKDKEWLKEKFEKENIPKTKIAEKFGMSRHIITPTMNKLEIETGYNQK